MARLIQVIETYEKRGSGKSLEDPVRNIKQYYDFDGNLLWEEKDDFLVPLDEVKA